MYVNVHMLTVTIIEKYGGKGIHLPKAQLSYLYVYKTVIAKKI